MSAKGAACPQGAIQDVLVVDDSRVQRRIACAYLQRWGYHVREAENAEMALRLCGDHPPDLVLSDWMMPGLTGPEFCRAFRDLPREDYGYFILLTSKSEKNDIACGLDAGADDFLTKPINGPELRARISAGDRILQMERELTAQNRVIEASMKELQKLYDAIDSDLIEARKLQQSLVRERFREFGTADVSLLLRPCGHVGGDLVGFYPINATRIGLFGIDVSGHGISSALMTARLAGFLSSSAPDQNVAFRRDERGAFVPRPPSETLVHLNELILTEIETEHYFTMVLADVSLETGRVVICQAGHPHPLIQRANGRVEAVGRGGLPVGLLECANYDEEEVHLAPGDRLILPSDGVTECNGVSQIQLGEDGIARILTDLRQTTGLALLDSLVWKLSEFSGRNEFDDDVSAVLLEFKPNPCNV